MSRFVRIVVSGFAAILFASMLGSCRPLAEYAADKVYPDLQTYYDKEAPPTPRPFPASSSITAVIGGRGEGLSCSIPPLLEWAMFEREEGDAAISLQFRQACAYHDYCYRHGHATYGYTRNDCDYALQQTAYRICRVRISGGADPKECLSRARRVLLGVTLGGGSSFANHEQSTYFEFDPMPHKADDYVVVRWVKRSKGSTADKHSLNGQFVVMHYKRGTVKSRVVKSIPFSASTVSGSPQPFPKQYIATPPFVVRDGMGDKLWAVARNHFHNTAIQVVEYTPSSSGGDASQVREVKEKYDDDPDASVFWFSKSRPDELSYWSYTQKFGTANLKNPIPRELVEYVDYRTLQHTPLEGSFFKGGCIDTAVMRRGGPQKGGNDNGDGFDDTVHLVFVRPATPPCTRHAPVTLAAKQAQEPLSVVRLDKGRDVLLSLQPVQQQIQLLLFDLARTSGSHPAQPVTLTLPAQFDPSWLKMPPQILSDASSASSLLFFSRYVQPVPKAAKDRQDPARPTKPEQAAVTSTFEFSYFRLVANDAKVAELIAQGSGSCQVNLSIQSKAVRSNTLGSRIAVSFPDDNDKNREEKIEGAILRDLNERWANAQIIPGWFLQREGADDSGPLDVAVFFRGYPEYAFLAQGKKDEAAGVGFETVAPSYVKCT